MPVRPVLLAAFVVASVLVTGCTHASTTTTTATASPQPAPTDPDLGSVMENYYEQIEGKHWSFAYGMLSDRYRGELGRDAFITRYWTIENPDVRVRQLDDRTVDATLTGTDAQNPARQISVDERATLAWDGQSWVIDAITRAAP